MPFDHKQLKLIAPKGSMLYIASENKSQVTIVACANAAGYCFTTNGRSLFLIGCLLKHIPPQWPVLLILDGHSTHFVPYALALATKNGVQYCVYLHMQNTLHSHLM
jgi:hypothetical protein